ncbi:hypothetical protein PIB30_093776 [Stylosanthes scabra]|uniref:EF-hand domain-containing protein n=1 Tax=Stylosanthes scabra TaxID=79078 RepID=A0ABU6ZU80_9FABA|nr:hypothetical protein [Stylosanthes scabra]
MVNMNIGYFFSTLGTSILECKVDKDADGRITKEEIKEGVACGGAKLETNGNTIGSCIFCPSHNYAVLKHQMEAAAKSED